MLDIIFDKNTSNLPSNLGNFKIEYYNNIEERIDLYKKIFNSIPTIKDRLNNKKIIDIDSNTTIFNIVCFSISPNCKFMNFIKDLEKAKYYKKLMTYNNLLDNIKIYNNTIGKICKSRDNIDTEDMFTLDSLKLQDISLIHMNFNESDDIIIGANNLIKTQKPILLIKYDGKINDDTLFLNLNHFGYTHIQYENYSIYY
jgi:hypothetical protein